MHIRPSTPDDFDGVLALTIDTFGPFHEDIVRPLYGEVIFTNRHGRWREDYREQVCAQHDPAKDRFAVVADDDDQLAGYIAWHAETEKRYGEIDTLVVRDGHRGRGLGTTLCEVAFAGLRDRGAEVVTIGTGATDSFHAPARALYESLGCTRIDVAVYLREL